MAFGASLGPAMRARICYSDKSSSTSYPSLPCSVDR